MNGRRYYGRTPPNKQFRVLLGIIYTANNIRDYLYNKCFADAKKIINLFSDLYMFVPKIETGRLLMRMYKPEELEIVYKMLSDKNVTRFYPPGFTIERADVLSSMPRRLGRWRDHGFGQLGVFEKESGKLTGYCGLQYFDSTPEVELFYGFFKEFWGKGYATEAATAMLRFGFEQTNLDKIAAGTHPDNFVSQKVLTKIGMEKFVGLKRFYNIDSVYFSILRGNYKPDETAKYAVSFTEIND